MKSGRPNKIRFKKQVRRRKYGHANKGAASPRQIAASVGRNRVRRNRRRK